MVIVGASMVRRLLKEIQIQGQFDDFMFHSQFDHFERSLGVHLET
jgi:hypothetical protein